MDPQSSSKFNNVSRILDGKAVFLIFRHILKECDFEKPKQNP